MRTRANGSSATQWIRRADLIDAGLATWSQRRTRRTIIVRTRTRRIETTTFRVLCANFGRARMAVLIQCRTRRAIIMCATASRMRLAAIRIHGANIVHARMASIVECRARRTIIV